MIRIANMTFEADIDVGIDTISVTIADTLTNAQIVSIRDARTLERLDMSYNEIVGVLALYNLVEWQKIEKTRNGLRFCWQIYRTTDLEQLRQDNEDLTAAVLELASLIGGEENG